MSTFTTITSVTMIEEPDAVEALAKRFESFGESHPLYPAATRLREKAAASHAKVDAYKASIKAENLIHAKKTAIWRRSAG